MSTIKAKNIKQTVVGTTIQPLKLGGILDDGSDAKISIDTSGNLTASNLTATLNGLLTTNGQIKFPATQNPSADANTLDDYEEGTFTPTIVGTSTAGTGTYSQQVGKYTKIGNIVNAYIWLTWTNHTGTGYLIVGNLPFTSYSGDYVYPIATVATSNLLLSANNYISNGYVGVNSTNIVLVQRPIGGGIEATVPMDTAATVYLSVSYFTND